MQSSVTDREMQVKLANVFHLEHHSIVGQDGCLLYEAIALLHLSKAAKERLAEIHTQQPGIDYESAEAILIDEGLFSPENEAE